MSSRSNMSGSACAKPGVTILARVRGACRDAYLTEFPANWYAARRWTKMGSASVLYQGQGPARDILGATDGYGRTCTDPACAAQPRGGRLGELGARARSEEHTSELQSPCNLVCRLLLEKKKQNN